MAFFEVLDEKLTAFIQKQAMFFVATAPTEGRINLSPKGLDTLRCLDKTTVAFLDLTGSGNETAAHLSENGRLTMMFCSFAAEPKILRLYGTGTVIGQHDSKWDDFSQHFPSYPGTRQIIVLHIQSIQTSCGFGVPRMDLVGQRDTLGQWAEKKGPEGLKNYWREKNANSIDGLPTHLDPIS